MLIKLLQHKKDTLHWTSMTKEEWKKNDALMAAALKKMDLFFFRDKKSWEAKVFASKSKKYECECYDANDNILSEGPNTPESLGEIKTFFVCAHDSYFMDNIFFGVKNFAELQIKVDLMA